MPTHSDELHEVVAVRHIGGHRLHVRIDGGVEGDLDVRDVLGESEGLLAPLRDPAYLSSVRVESGTLVWPNGADLCELELYDAVRSVARTTSGAGAKREPCASASSPR